MPLSPRFNWEFIVRTNRLSVPGDINKMQYTCEKHDTEHYVCLEAVTVIVMREFKYDILIKYQPVFLLNIFLPNMFWHRCWVAVASWMQIRAPHVPLLSRVHYRVSTREQYLNNAENCRGCFNHTWCTANKFCEHNLHRLTEDGMVYENCSGRAFIKRTFSPYVYLEPLLLNQTKTAQRTFLNDR